MYGQCYMLFYNKDQITHLMHVCLLDSNWQFEGSVGAALGGYSDPQ